MKLETLARLLLFPLAFAMTLAFVPARSALAQVSGDDDGDGVVDAADQCFDTPAGDLVSDDGCSLCPCAAPLDGTAWTSHRPYVDCVVRTAHHMRAAHELSRREMRGAVRRARQSTCGTETLTRCCVYAHLDTDAAVVIGQCRLTTAEACNALTAEVDLADDMGPGSCMPNPCLF